MGGRAMDLGSLPRGTHIQARELHAQSPSGPKLPLPLCLPTLELPPAFLLAVSNGAGSPLPWPKVGDIHHHPHSLQSAMQADTDAELYSLLPCTVVCNYTTAARIPAFQRPMTRCRHVTLPGKQLEGSCAVSESMQMASVAKHCTLPRLRSKARFRLIGVTRKKKKNACTSPEPPTHTALLSPSVDT
ncbi:hypothetical protein LX36DRAFT_381953 [Colletotrichum falcatum]|nr:hypothetical protein LX36DRAFT_381953 [Colletotrichum falcatum]